MIQHAAVNGSVHERGRESCRTRHLDNSGLERYSHARHDTDCLRHRDNSALERYSHARHDSDASPQRGSISSKRNDATQSFRDRSRDAPRDSRDPTLLRPTDAEKQSSRDRSRDTLLGQTQHDRWPSHEGGHYRDYSRDRSRDYATLPGPYANVRRAFMLRDSDGTAQGTVQLSILPSCLRSGETRAATISRSGDHTRCPDHTEQRQPVHSSCPELSHGSCLHTQPSTT
jgi:hypothetical protein